MQKSRGDICRARPEVEQRRKYEFRYVESNNGYILYSGSGHSFHHHRIYLTKLEFYLLHYPNNNGLRRC